MIEKLQTSEEQENLHIVENMDVNNLPQLMQKVLSLANTPAEKDMLLMSALTACGSVMLFNWSEEWQEHGVIAKIRHGVFKKCLAVA